MDREFFGSLTLRKDPVQKSFTIALLDFVNHDSNHYTILPGICKQSLSDL